MSCTSSIIDLCMYLCMYMYKYIRIITILLFTIDMTDVNIQPSFSQGFMTTTRVWTYFHQHKHAQSIAYFTPIGSRVFETPKLECVVFQFPPKCVRITQCWFYGYWMLYLLTVFENKYLYIKIYFRIRCVLKQLRTLFHEIGSTRGQRPSTSRDTIVMMYITCASASYFAAGHSKSLNHVY